MLKKLSLLAGMLTLSATFVVAQGIITGVITGTVADPTGAILPGATITAVRASTNSKYTAKAGSDGAFSLNDLPIGTYTVTVSDDGFTGLTLNNVEVSANRTDALGIEKLTTGGTAEVVNVSTAQNILETSSDQVTTTFDTKQVENLPTSGGFDELTLLIPGVVATHGDNFSNTNGTGFSANGQRGRSNNFELDGQSNNDNSIGGPQFFFSNDEALAEVQIITDNFGAQYGRNAGSVVNYITKSGTNQIHGSATYRYGGDFTSSLDTGVSKGVLFGFCAPGQVPSSTVNCRIPKVPRFDDQEFGGTLGFPILKDKLFGFGGTYFKRLYESGGLATSGAAYTPTPAGLAALASAFPNNAAIPILQQISPFSIAVGNPQTVGTPVNETVTDGTTTATIPFSQFSRQYPFGSRDQEDLGRIDYQVTPKDRYFLRYAYQKAPTSPYSQPANGAYFNVSSTTHAIGSDITHTFSPNWVDQLRYSFQQSKLNFDGGAFPNCTITSFSTCPSNINLGAISGLSLGGLGLPTNAPQGRIVKVNQVQNNATFTKGAHSITFGGEYDYQNSPNVFLPNSNGGFNFSSFNNFLQGVGSVNLTVGSPVVPFQENDVAVYFQDDWKVSQSFTANLGLRWEFFQQAINLLHDKSVAQQLGPNPFWSTALPLSETTFPAINQSYRNFEPRIGFAYNPQAYRNLVIRGGYAINVDPGFYNINLNSATAAPVVNAGTVTCNATTGISCLPQGGATYSTVNAQYTQYIPTGGNPGARNLTLVTPNFKQPFSQTYSLGVQYQVANRAVVEVRYVGNHVSGQFQSLNSNPYLAPVAADFPNFVNPSILCSKANSTLAGNVDVGHLYCGNTNVRTRANTAFSIYNGLQTSVTTRDYHGATATFSYTYSRTISNSSEIFGTLGAGNTNAFAQNPLDTNVGERSVDGNSFPNVVGSSLVYAVPKIGSEQTLVGHLINGWQLNTLWVYNSGQPYNDFEFYQSLSPQVNKQDPNTYTTYGDEGFNLAYVGPYDNQRPILSNPKAPASTLGIYTDTTTATDANGKATAFSAPVLVDYKTGASVTPSQVRFIATNKLAAKMAGTPYPGSQRNILRGDSYNNVDASIFKDTHLSDRVLFRLEANAFNVLNRSYYGTPGNFEGSYGSGNFNNFSLTPAAGGLDGPGTGVRNMKFGAKILF